MGKGPWVCLDYSTEGEIFPLLLLIMSMSIRCNDLYSLRHYLVHPVHCCRFVPGNAYILKHPMLLLHVCRGVQL